MVLALHVVCAWWQITIWWAAQDDVTIINGQSVIDIGKAGRELADLLVLVQAHAVSCEVIIQSGDIDGVGVLTLVPAVSEGFALADGEALEVAWRTGGERCTPLKRGRSQSLKKLFQEYRVPPWWRDRVPLASVDGEMLAVADLWLCQSTRLRARSGDGESIWNLHWHRNTFTAAN